MDKGGSNYNKGIREGSKVPEQLLKNLFCLIKGQWIKRRGRML